MNRHQAIDESVNTVIRGGIITRELCQLKNRPHKSIIVSPELFAIICRTEFHRITHQNVIN